jgi:hypothetical protein
MYMRFKALLPVILAIAVLSNSCFASACQVVCDDATSAAGCHAGQAPAASAMAGMRHCSMCVHAASIKAIGTATPCPHDVCELQPASVSYASVEAVQLFTSNPLTVFAAARRPVLRFTWTETPPLRRTSSAFSYIILRV